MPQQHDDPPFFAYGTQSEEVCLPVYRICSSFFRLSMTRRLVVFPSRLLKSVARGFLELQVLNILLRTASRRPGT